MNSIRIIDQVVNYHSHDRDGMGRSPEKGSLKEGSGGEHSRPVNRQELDAMIQKLNGDERIRNEKIAFRYHESTDRVIVSVLDAETEEVVREIPSKDMIRLIEHLRDYIGVLVDESR